MMEKKDPLLREAFTLILENESASVSLIQRRLKLGYNRSSRIMDQLETLKAVGPFRGAKPREILMNDISELEV